MGVVYKAEDTRLDRPVALKFLPAQLLGDEEVKKRFKREAKAAAALDHSNVCTVYEIDEADSKTFISMALIEGESLDKKIEQGPLKLDEALDIGQQIAKGLEAAHKKGVVHRDIKPQNIMVGDDGHVTIMDFGLAQLTQASLLTRPDQTMGTVFYMSPEQTEGSGTDHRTDIWSLGVVLYEMITGQKPFKGDYDKAVMYSILNEEPEPITAIRAGVPMELEVVVGKCLAKDPVDRYDSASDVAKDLRSLGEKLKSGRSTIIPAVSAPRSRHSPLLPSEVLTYDSTLGHKLRLMYLLAAGLAVALAIVSLRTSGDREDRRQVRRFSFVPDLLSGTIYDGAMRRAAISPDGRWITYVSEDPSALWLRPIDEETPRKLEGTEGAKAGMFWSPDSRFIGFATDRKLKKLSVTGGMPITLCDLAGSVWAGGAWSPDGESIVFDFPDLYEVSAQGGEPRMLLERLGVGQNNHEPHFIPGSGRAMLFTFGSRTVRTIYLYNFETDETAEIVEGSNPNYSRSGHILYQTAPFGGELWALPFSSETLEVTGEPFFVAQNVADATIAADDTLVTVDQFDGPDNRLVWRDREGRMVGSVGQPQGPMDSPSISPDGQQVAVEARGDRGDPGDIWLHQVNSAIRRRFSFEQGRVGYPSWSPNGDMIAFMSNTGRASTNLRK